MAVEISYPHIVKRPGEPARLERHKRTRVSQIVLDYTEHGWSPDEIQRLAKTTPPAPFLARLKALKRRNADAALS